MFQSVHIEKHGVIALVSLKDPRHGGRRGVREHGVDQEALAMTRLESDTGAYRAQFSSSEPDQFPGPQRPTRRPGTVVRDASSNSTSGTPFWRACLILARRVLSCSVQVFI